MCKHEHILSAEQLSFNELRNRFREEARRNLRARLNKASLVVRDREGNVVKEVPDMGLMTDAPLGHEHRRVDEFLAAGEFIPDLENMPSDEFLKLGDSNGLQRELRDLERDAKQFEEHERVDYGAEETGEGPELASLDDEAVDAYMQEQIKRGK